MSRRMAIVAVAVCALIWGTTWYAITWQLGTVDPIASVVWRFGLAGAVLMLACLALRLPLRLTRAQHLAALGQGGFAFSVSYSFTYAAEGHVASAIVAVVFASMTLINLVLFRLFVRQKAALSAWGAALLGVTGVGLLSGGEVLGAGFDARAATGVALALVAVTASAFGNLFAWKGQQEGAPVLPATAWAMAYGAGLLGLYGLLTGVQFRLDPSPGYLISLAYLALFGSVIAFGLYFTVARVIGYAMASYVSALTPPIAMLVSVLFESARFGWAAAVGLVLVLAGQVLLIRANRPQDAA